MNFSPSSVADHLPVCTLAAALAIALAGCNPKDGVGEYADGMAAYEAHSLEKAGKLFAKSLEFAPDNVDALVMLARVRCERGEIPEAGEAIAKAVALDPDSPDVALLDAEIALYAGDYGRATERFSAVANDEKLDAEARALGWTGLGIVEMTRDNRRDFARIAFLRAIRTDRRNASARYHLGLLYRGDSYGYLDAALEQFEIFVRLGETADPRAVHAQRVIIPGIKADIARRAAERARGHRDANAAAAALARAEAAWKKGSYKLARDEYSMAAKEDPLSYSAMLGLARAWAKTDSSQAGRQRTLDCYMAACALRPSAISTFLVAGDLAAKLGRNASAVELYSRALAANPSDISAIDGLIRALRKTGNRENRNAADAYQSYRDSIPVRKAR